MYSQAILEKLTHVGVIMFGGRIYRRYIRVSGFRPYLIRIRAVLIELMCYHKVIGLQIIISIGAIGVLSYFGYNFNSKLGLSLLGNRIIVTIRIRMSECISGDPI